ncbi:MAG: hypothetical protein O3C40_25775 [Planctomycetota bacterium]|nr:hypothetical protein [Planctomycetota bacterium]
MKENNIGTKSQVTTGAMVQVFLLTPDAIPLTRADRESIECADDDGLHPAAADFQNHSNSKA